MIQFLRTGFVVLQTVEKANSLNIKACGNALIKPGEVRGVDISFLIIGFTIGFLTAAPVGPISVLCMRRTLAEGRTYGLISGLGAATADAIYGGIAGFGLTFISDFLKSQQMWLRLVGGIFLCILGIKTFYSKPAEYAASVRRIGLISAYASTVFLTLTNPVTIFSFGFAYAGLGVAGAGGDYASATLLVLGVFTGSALWWFTLSESVNLFRKKLMPTRLRWINRISGIIIAGLGVIALSSLVFRLIVQKV